MAKTSVIYDTSNGKIRKTYKSLGWAQRGLMKILREDNTGGEVDLVATTADDYQKTGAVTANETVTVYSIFDTKNERPIQIRRADVGGACDPSTERYHSM